MLSDDAPQGIVDLERRIELNLECARTHLASPFYGRARAYLFCASSCALEASRAYQTPEGSHKFLEKYNEIIRDVILDLIELEIQNGNASSAQFTLLLYRGCSQHAVLRFSHSSALPGQSLVSINELQRYTRLMLRLDEMQKVGPELVQQSADS